MEGLFKKIEALGFTVEACGSRVTCNPPPTDTDQDYLVAIPKWKPFDRPISAIVDLLNSENFVWEGSPEHYQQVAGHGFMSWRKGDVNLIVTGNAAWAEKHRLATALCKYVNTMDKKHRIAIFKAILYGEKPLRDVAG
jgi:hypothetical protein